MWLVTSRTEDATIRKSTACRFRNKSPWFSLAKSDMSLINEPRRFPVETIMDSCSFCCGVRAPEAPSANVWAIFTMPCSGLRSSYEVSAMKSSFRPSSVTKRRDSCSTSRNEDLYLRVITMA
ncbi:hypothetical protein D3C75_1132880 [compost metagenome]